MRGDVDRRAFLRWMGLGLGATSVAACTSGRGWESASPAPTTTTTSTTAAPIALDGAPAATVDTSSRVLVVLELQGGNDGLATVVPAGDPALAGLRGDLSPDPDAVIGLAGDVGFHPALANVAPRLSVVQGVGSYDPDLSHFESFRRLWEGDPTGQVGYAASFLGRCCDVLAGDEVVTGVSLGWGPSPALVSSASSTIALADLGVAWFLDDENEWLDPYRRGLAALAEPAGEDRFQVQRTGLRSGLDFVDVLRDLPEPDGRYPDTELGARFGLAGRIVRSEMGARVIHVPFGDFDTHDDQRSRHDDLMGQIDAALGAFLRELDDTGLADRVLVATTSEFGRRVERNGSGTDHGSASVAMLAGPVAGLSVGDRPSLTRLDDEGNLRTTVSYDDYLATLAEHWLGVPRSEVFESAPSTMPELVTA
ncbi:MAG: DUF1501 domain-containing protein [Actinomycetota bacterium]